MNRKKSLPLMVCLFFAVLGGNPASADLISGEALSTISAPQYPPYAMVYSENLDYNLGYWENIDQIICQPGGFCQSFKTSPGQEYELIIDFAGQDPGITNLEMRVGDNDCTYDLGAIGNNPITFAFQATGNTETLKLSPTSPSIPGVPAPPAVLLLGSGLICLALARRKARGSTDLFRFPQN